MEKIQAQGYDIVFGKDSYTYLGEVLNQKQYTKLFILCDTNTNEYCMPYFLAHLPIEIDFEIIEVEPGEENKVLETAQGVIESMLELAADRNSAMLTVGGGVITDLGGFISSIYMRGIDCYNIPTTLLSMVDASVGGKTGVDCNGVKNCIGTFSMPKMVVVDVHYLETLPVDQIKSGYAEMLKHGLIYDGSYYDFLKDISNVDLADLENLVKHSVNIKNQVVSQDPKESGLRKILNYGHTIGHAIESYFLSQQDKETLLHGQAIAIGMVIEAYLSTELCGLSKEAFKDIKDNIQGIFGQVDISQNDIENILQWLKFDKKNSQGNVRCVLLKQIGEPVYDIVLSKDLILKGFDAYLQ
ncbi:3-dehydroquinate synthase [Myroides sp. LJL119]